MLASFNYYGPPTGTFVVGVVVAVALLVVLGWTRSALAGLFGGALGWGLIAVAVFGCGKGDMTGLLQAVYGTVFSVVGAVAGLVAGLIGKSTKKS